MTVWPQILMIILLTLKAFNSFYLFGIDGDRTQLLGRLVSLAIFAGLMLWGGFW